MAMRLSQLMYKSMLVGEGNVGKLFIYLKQCESYLKVLLAQIKNSAKFITTISFLLLVSFV